MGKMRDEKLAEREREREQMSRKWRVNGGEVDRIAMGD